MITRKVLPRRIFLRGMGAAVALPFLDAMVPALKGSTIPGGSPIRMGFVYVPNGIEREGFDAVEGRLVGELARADISLSAFTHTVSGPRCSEFALVAHIAERIIRGERLPASATPRTESRCDV